MTLTQKKIQRMVDNYQYIALITQRHKYDGEAPTIEEQMTQLYHFLKDQMQDVEREDRQEAMQARMEGNSGYSKGSH